MIDAFVGCTKRQIVAVVGRSMIIVLISIPHCSFSLLPSEMGDRASAVVAQVSFCCFAKWSFVFPIRTSVSTDRIVVQTPIRYTEQPGVLRGVGEECESKVKIEWWKIGQRVLRLLWESYSDDSQSSRMRKGMPHGPKRANF